MSEGAHPGVKRARPQCEVGSGCGLEAGGCVAMRGGDHVATRKRARAAGTKRIPHRDASRGLTVVRGAASRSYEAAAGGGRNVGPAAQSGVHNTVKESPVRSARRAPASGGRGLHRDTKGGAYRGSQCKAAWRRSAGPTPQHEVGRTAAQAKAGPQRDVGSTRSRPSARAAMRSGDPNRGLDAGTTPQHEASAHRVGSGSRTGARSGSHRAMRKRGASPLSRARSGEFPGRRAPPRWRTARRPGRAAAARAKAGPQRDVGPPPEDGRPRCDAKRRPIRRLNAGARRNTKRARTA